LITLNVQCPTGHRLVTWQLELRACPHIWAPRRPGPSDRRLVRSGGSKVWSSQFRACPHIWVPEPAWTARPALGQVRWVKARSPQLCVCPKSGHHSRPEPSDRRLVRSGGSKVWPSKFRVCPHIWAGHKSGRPNLVSVPISRTSCLSPYLVPRRLSNMIIRRPRRDHRTACCQRSRY